MAEHPANIFWFGGAGVVTRYDGYEYREYGSEQGLQGSKVLNFASHPTIGLIAGTDQGLFRWSEKRWLPILTSDTPQAIQARDITVLADQSILVALSEQEESSGSSQRWHGLLHLTDEQTRLYSKAPPPDLKNAHSSKPVQHTSVPDETCILMDGQLRLNVTSVTQSQDGSIWAAISQNNRAGNRAAKFRYDPLTKTLSLDRVFKEPDGPELESFTSILETDDGEIWITSNNSTIGIAQWDGHEWRQQRLSDFFPSNEAFYHMLKTSDGAIWVDGSGKYFRYQDGQWKRYAFPQIPITLSNRINFFEASDGAVWIIATNSSVFRLDYSSTPWNHRKGLAYQFETDDSSRWYLAEDGRVVRENGGQWVSYGIEDGIIDNPIRLFRTSTDEIWAIGSHQGHAALAHSAHHQSWVTIEYPDLSWSFDHRAAFEDKNGVLYFASAVDTPPHQKTGIIRFNNPSADKSDQTRFGEHRDFLTKQSYYGIGQSPDGRIWFGGRPPLVLQDEERKVPPEMPETDVFIDYIFQQPNQHLWLVTRDRGILEIGTGGNRWHNVSTGLPSHSIASGFSNSPNNVWLALNDQIIRYDGKGWSTFFSPKEQRYSRGTVTFNSDSDGVVHIAQTSNYWLRRGYPGNEYTPGIESFNTLSYHDDKMPPTVRITHFEPEVGDTGNTTVTWSGTDFLERTPRHQLEYSYKINDSPWSAFTQLNNKRLQGLAPGPYTVQVRSRNRGFNISPVPATASFRVAAPTWQQPWFLATITSLVALVAFFLYQTIRRSQSLASLNAKLVHSNQQLNEQQQTIENQNLALKSQQVELEKRVKERTEDLEKAKLRAEESDRLKSAFLANVSHEIRTPMNAILGFSELLMHNLPEGEEERSFLQTIQNSGKDLLNLIDDIIEVSKLESEGIETEDEHVPVEWILSQTRETFRGVLARLGKNRLELVIDKDQLPTGAIARTDSHRLKQVLKNLISNAIKFTPQGVVRLRCAASPNRDALQFSVEDTGFGIKQEHLGLIFQRFRKADPNEGHSYRGSGLGLSISQNLVQKLGGELRVDSEFGHGSRFYFSLPWDGNTDGEARPNHPHPNQIKPPAAAPHLPILLVEDEEANFTLLSKMLESLDLAFVHAKTAERAIEICQQQSFAAVLMDIKLPEMQGDEAALRIKEIAPALPIISQTAYAMAGERERYSQYPFTAYLSKPLSLEKLAATINAALEG